MRSTLVLRATQARQPMIRFLGKRSTPKHIDHTPKPHPESPTRSLPDSFASYRERAQQHGPMGASTNSENPIKPIAFSIAAMQPYGAIGGTPARRLGPVQPKEGEFFDRSELPKRFARLSWTEAEMDAITSGGASLW